MRRPHMMALIPFVSTVLILMAATSGTVQPADVGSKQANEPLRATDDRAVLANDNSQNASGLLADIENTMSVAEEAGSRNACSSICYCDSIIKRVNCSSRGLSDVPLTLPDDVQYLDLSRNNISDVSVVHFQSLADLRTLDLSHNQLRTLPLVVFSGNGRLESLYVQDNRLEIVDLTCPGSEPTEVVTGLAESSPNVTNVTSGVCNMTSLRLLELSTNNLSRIPEQFLNAFPQLNYLILDGNRLGDLPNNLTGCAHGLHRLSVNGNSLRLLNWNSVKYLSELRVADFGNNRLYELPDSKWFQQLSNVHTLTLSGNPLTALSPGAFFGLTALRRLHLAYLDGLRYLPERAFAGLSNLTSLNISHSPNLEFIHHRALTGLGSLQLLDISYCGLSWISKNLVENVTYTLRLEGNPWHCDCDLVWLSQWLQQETSGRNGGPRADVLCSNPASLSGHSFLNNTVTSMMLCESPDVVEPNVTLWFKIASDAVIDCLNSGNAKTKITWITPKKLILVYDPTNQDLYSSDPDRPGYHDGHYWHKDTNYYHLSDVENRIIVLYNGSLYLDYVTRVDAGDYTCIADNGYLNQTVVIQVRLAYGVISWLKLYTIIWGFICAFTFFFIAMLASTIWYYSHKCSSEERRKRKSIREVLDSLQDFKTIQIDRLCAYKTAKINKFSAFKTDKMHKLVAFKTAKIDKLRTYKQVTMASIFHHLEKMREHYNYQMNRVKDNCTQQVEKLRENYASQIVRIKDYKSEKMDQIRDNYNSQMLKIKEYRTFQMNKLREQYKLQQQHLLKLMELLDIGNCLHIVEAECMRTESMIFDPNISIDLEAEPVHVQRDMDLSDIESEYMTAGSQSDLSVSETTITAGAFPGGCAGEAKGTKKTKHKATKMKQGTYGKEAGHRANRSSDSSSDQSQSSPSQFQIRVIPEPLPAPPMFSYSASDIDDMPLDHLVAKIESDALSMYQTPPSSAHKHKRQDSAGSRLAREVLHDSQEARKSVTDSTSTAYDTAEQSREPSPEPSYTNCDEDTSDNTDMTAKESSAFETIV